MENRSDGFNSNQLKWVSLNNSEKPDLGYYSLQVVDLEFKTIECAFIGDGCVRLDMEKHMWTSLTLENLQALMDCLKRTNKKKNLNALGFNNEVYNSDRGLCALCLSPVKAENFTDDLSKKEFNISGLCQSCQDKIFTPDNER